MQLTQSHCNSSVNSKERSEIFVKMNTLNLEIFFNSVHSYTEIFLFSVNNYDRYLFNGIQKKKSSFC